MMNYCLRADEHYDSLIAMRLLTYSICHSVADQKIRELHGLPPSADRTYFQVSSVDFGGQQVLEMHPISLMHANVTRYHVARRVELDVITLPVGL